MANENEKSLVVRPDVEGTIQALNAFQKLKESVLNENDVVKINEKKYIKRSGWRKIALAFNISTEIISVEREKLGEMYIVRVKARASAPNGRVSEEIAVCDSSEFSGKLIASLHNVETKAATRAINRAISNLVGGGEVSAEEVVIEEEIETQRQQPPAPKEEMITDKQRSAIVNYGIADNEKSLYIEFYINKTGKDISALTRKEASALIEQLTTNWSSARNDFNFQRWRESHLRQ